MTKQLDVQTDPAIAATLRYRRARLAYEDAQRAFDEAMAELDVHHPHGQTQCPADDFGGPGRAWVFHDGQIDANIRAVAEAMRAGKQSHSWPSTLAGLREEGRRAKQRLRDMQLARHRASIALCIPRLSHELSVARREMERATTAALWTLARTPAGIGSQVALLRSELEEARALRPWQNAAHALHAGARGFLEPLCGTIERSARRLGVAIERNLVVSLTPIAHTLQLVAPPNA